MKKYNIKISKAALKTLDQNILFLRKFDINYSIKVREKIIKSIDKFMLFPYYYSIYKKSNKYFYSNIKINKFYTKGCVL